jgi:hypothetical protein
MKRLGSSLRPDYEPVIRSPLPPRQRDLLLQYAVAEAVRQGDGRSHEVVPHLPS